MRKWLVAVLAVCFGFACFGVACKKDTNEKIRVYMPDGAPALALAYAMHQDREDDGVYYEVVDAQNIQSYLTYKDEKKNAEFCVLPLNLASKLVGDGKRYGLLGTLTHGNLYLLSQNGETYTRENLSLLIGKTVGVVQLKNVPGIFLKVVLTDLGIEYCELTSGEAPRADKVNLKAVSPDAVMPTDGIDVFVAPEPAASVKAEKTALDFAGDLQRLYGGESGYPQAVLVVKKSFLQKNGAFVKSFIEKIKDGAEWLKTAEISVACGAVSSHLTKGLQPSLTVANLSREGILRSNVWFSSAKESKAEINTTIEKMIAVGGAASILNDGFFLE